MEETAQILEQATSHSLVILDEVGRGTSTYDGLALAQAIVEYIFKKVGARCLFATHYHELTDLQRHYPGIVSYFADSVRTASGIVFLHKIVAGKADGSFGLEVAKLAHIPLEVVERARQILAGLHENEAILTEDGSDDDLAIIDQVSNPSVDPQANLIVNRFKQVDFDNLSPKKAFDLLWELKDLMP